MTALALIPLAIIVLAVLYRPARPARIGFVERTARGVAPMPPPEKWQRLNRWAALYGRTTIEQQLAPGAWPFAPSAVHELPKSALVDVRELVTKSFFAGHGGALLGDALLGMAELGDG